MTKKNEVETKDDSKDIKIDSPISLKKKDLPLVVKLDDKASPAQREYARIINGYAYVNADKFEAKKKAFEKRLAFLADRDLPNVEDANVKLTVSNDNKANGTPFRFKFMHDKQGNIVDVIINLA